MSIPQVLWWLPKEQREYWRNSAELLDQKISQLFEGKWVFTSPYDARYNCVAHALGENHRWWQHDGPTWLTSVPSDNKWKTYTKVFESRGFARTESAEYKADFDRIAVYSRDRVSFSHVAIQLGPSRWRSKLGMFPDVEHALPDPIGYGAIVQLLERNVRKSRTDPKRISS